MSDLSEELERNKKRLRRQESLAAREIIKSYRITSDTLKRKINSVDLDLSGAGGIWKLQRLESLLKQVEAELTSYATGPLKKNINSRRTQAALLAQDHQLRLIGIQDPKLVASFTKLPVNAIETMFAATNSGPLNRLLASFGPDTASSMRQILIEGVALGHNPKKVASLLTNELGISRKRALLISRTEILRANREASRETYRNNKHIVKGWSWHSATDDRTCLTCWAMHGTLFETDEMMPSHPGCRCGMVPVTKSWTELGFTDIPETSYQSQTGSSLFAKQSPQTQKTILGSSAYESYKRGDVDITDFVGYKHSPTWGTSVTRKPNRTVIPGE